MNEAQAAAVADAYELERLSEGLFQVIEVTDSESETGPVLIEISLDCRSMPVKEGGVQLRRREILRLSVGAGFPLDAPVVTTPHQRFAGRAHVQWGKQICLYQATDAEWVPQGGVPALVKRIIDWLRSAAANELDAIGGPIHPPVAYLLRADTPLVVFADDTPAVTGGFWTGSIEIHPLSQRAIQLRAWRETGESFPETYSAGAVLLGSAMPFEYPTTVTELRQRLAECGIPYAMFALLLQISALHAPEESPIYLVVGSAWRGTAGAAERLQHLACWEIPKEDAAKVRQVALADGGITGAIAEITFDEWMGSAKVDWCRVAEQRPEIVQSRDRGSRLSWWRDKTVAIIGCGALGGPIAVALARTGVRKLSLIDKGLVTPGLLVRQPFPSNHIGYAKTASLKGQIGHINPALEVETHYQDLRRYLANHPDALLAYDVIVNATASTSAATALEMVFGKATTRPPVFSVAIGHEARNGMATLSSSSDGVTLDLDRRAKIELSGLGHGRSFYDEFWPDPSKRTPLFQPEPGCSEPTFVGSIADVQSLAFALLNIGSEWLKLPARQTAFAAFIDDTHSKRASLHFQWPQDQAFQEARHGYAVRVAPKALQDAQGWIRKSAREAGPQIETGGLIFGEVDELLKVIWITDVTGPPPDSLASAEGFVCGTQGTAALARERDARTRGSVRFIGMWHTHPDGAGKPSIIDLQAMNIMWAIEERLPRTFVMLIGGFARQAPQWRVSLFKRSEFHG